MNRVPWPWLLLLLAIIILASYLLCPVLCGCSEDGKEKATTSTISETPKTAVNVAATTLGPWEILDGSGLQLSSDDHFKFAKSEINHVVPLSGSLESAINQTADYLKSNPNRSLTITGYYQSDENNPSVFPNLGFARSNAIGKSLIALGVPAAQLINESRVITDGLWTDNILQQGVDFGFAEVINNDSRLADIKNRLMDKPLMLYFAVNQDHISLSATQRQDFQDIIYYINNVPDSQINISGHTDSIGERDANINLSKSRAEFAKRYITSNGGIGTNRISTQGFGPDKPVASNNTREGRANNRRVEVTLN